MNRKFRVAVVFLGTVVSQPGFAAENWPDSVDQYVAQVRKTIYTSDMDCYLTVVRNPNGALLLDVRDETELVSGHVPGTSNISRGRLEFRIWKLLGYPNKVDMNRKIYVQCSSGSVPQGVQIGPSALTRATCRGRPEVNGRSERPDAPQRTLRT